MLGKRRLLLCAVVLVALVGARVGMSVFGHSSRSLPLYSAAPGPERGEGLDRLDSYWNQRLTYPTGKYNPAWLRTAAAQDARIRSAVPAGKQRPARVAGRPGASLPTSGFTALGPNPERMTGCSGCFDYTKTAGRINAIVVDPTTTTPGSITAYAASVGGGVWKTTNCCTSSTSWTVTTDDPLITSIAIDTLTIDPNDHNTIYAGTGDLNYGSFSMGSQGILKSTNGGATWTVLGSSVFGPAYVQPTGQFPQYDAVGKVRVDPNNSQNVVAGTKKGVFVSYDGGTNWTGPCAPDSFSTMRQDITGLELSNMGGGVTRIVAAVGVRGFATTVQYDLNQNGANGIYSATMPASGCPSFTSIASNANGFVFGTTVAGSPYGTGANMNAGSGAAYVSTTSTSTVGDQLGRIDIAVAPSDPNVIYAQGQAIAPNNNSGCGNTNGCQLGMWVTTNGGTSWTFMAGSAGGALRNCVGTNTSSNPGDYPQNWYDQGIAVDPNNADRVFVDTYDIWLATRTGTALTDMSCGYNGSSAANHVVHVDQHALAFLPGSSSTLLAGSDGGTYSTVNANTASASPVTRPTWVNMDNGLNTIEFYSGDISGNFNTSATPTAAGGAQDNGPSSVQFSGTPTGSAQWQMGLGGDGFYARIDPVGTGTSLRIWEGNNSGGLSRCTSNCTASGASWSSRQGAWTSDTQSFVLPYDLFHGGIPGGDDCGVAGATTGCGHLIAGTTRVFETITGATSTNTWVITNTPTTQNMTKGTLGNRSFINQVKYSPKWQSVAMVGTNDANVWIGFNLGTGVASQANWVNVTGGNTVLPNRPVLGIALDPSSPNIPTEVGYAAVGGFNANTPTQPGHVFQVSCSASCTSFSWLDKTGNLPDIPVDSVIVNPNFPQQVFAGTDFGLFFTNDITAASPIWQRFTNGIPNAMIWDMQIDRGATTLSAWTRSRGAFVWPLPSSPFNKLSQTISFGSLTNRTYGDADFNVSATASSGLTVTFGAAGNCTVTGTLVHITGGGSCTITASQAGDADYSAAPDVPQTFTIATEGQTITFGPLADRAYNSGDFTVSATASSGLTVSFGASGTCTVAGTTVHLVSYGSCTITASQAGDADYSAAPNVPQTFAITDPVPPVTTATLSTPNNGGWYASPSLTLSADDFTGGSGVASIYYKVDGEATWHSHSGPAAVVLNPPFTTGNHYVQYYSVDVAGNIELVKLIAFKVDAQAPTVTITTPQDGSVYTQGSSKLAAFKCVDKQSGLASCNGSQSPGGALTSGTTALNTSTIGPHTVTVVGTDVAGNQTTATAHYTVDYQWNGFVAPVKNAEDQDLNLVHAGDLIKVKFGLGAETSTAVATASWTTVSCTPYTSWAPFVVGPSPGTPLGLTYGVAAPNYAYGWQTSAGWAGQCRQFSIQLNDGTPAHSAIFMFFA